VRSFPPPRLRPRLLLPLVGLCTACGPTPPGAPEPAGPPRPNFLFLYADDQRADTIAALGNPAIRTPNLDALAQAGFAFRSSYYLGSDVGATCRPSRNMLLSGRAYFRFDGPYASADAPNLPASLRDAGYETYHYGKRNNVAAEIERLFEHHKYLPDREELELGQPGRVIVDDAIEFLRHRDASRPFFMYLAFASPHDPRVAAPEWLEQYDPAAIPLPENFLPVHPFDNGAMTIRDEWLAGWPRTEEEIRGHVRDYWAVITGLDHHIGRLLRELETRDERRRTIVVFSSDSGLALGSHGLMGKQNLYEHSTKVPLIFAGPGIPSGESGALVYSLDVFPTLCELAGAPIPPGLDGESLVPLLRGDPVPWRTSLFTAYGRVMRAVRDDRWKIIRYPHLGRTQLFDLRDDPAERFDLAADPDQAGRIAAMTRLLEEWQGRFGDGAPLTWSELRDPAFTPPPEDRRPRGAREGT